jgi:REP element-mobilizing transposase RayT
MPKKNIVKNYGADQYYHVYNRGSNRQNIFIEPVDYFYFLGLFKRYLSMKKSSDSSIDHKYPNYADEVEIVAFCLMPSHFHLLLYLKTEAGIVHLMRSVMTTYTMYFNKKYKRTGKLCESAFLASTISNESYLWHVSRYIHLNPLDIGRDFRNYKYSSIAYFKGNKRADWIHTERMVKTSSEKQEYLEFVSDYETMFMDMKYLKNLLAT